MKTKNNNNNKIEKTGAKSKEQSKEAKRRLDPYKGGCLLWGCTILLQQLLGMLNGVAGRHRAMPGLPCLFFLLLGADDAFQLDLSQASANPQHFILELAQLQNTWKA